MSVISDEQARRGFPAHQRVNGTTVTRVLAAGGTDTVIGIWNEYSEDRLASLRPHRELAEGERVERHGLLQVDRTQTVLSSDKWTILGETWQTQRVGAVFGGYRELYLQRDDKVFTKQQSKNRLI
jgi:WD40 repeat protein